MTYRDWHALALKLIGTNPFFRQEFRAYARMCETPQQLVEGISHIASLLQKFRRYWEQHPAFSDNGNPYLVMVVWVFRHPPGLGGQRESYLISEIDDLQNLKWGMKRKDWRLTGIRPISPTLPVHDSRVLLLANGTSGRSAAYLCRMELKRLLPGRLKRMVSRLRRPPFKRKHEYLGQALPKWGHVATNYNVYIDPHRPQPLPDWFARVTVRDLWVEYVRTRYPQESKWLEYYMGSLYHLHDAIYGKIPHDMVITFFERLPAHVTDNRPIQLKLF